MTRPIRILLQSTIPYIDYNWDVDKGCSSFVEEPPGYGYKKEREALEDIKMFVRNAAVWLAPEVL